MSLAAFLKRFWDGSLASQNPGSATRPAFAAAAGYRKPVHNKKVVLSSIGALASLFLIIFVVGLHYNRVANLELSQNPEILRDEHIATASLRLLGLKLGDSESKIPQNLIQERTKYAAICKGGARFGVSNGRITGFRLDEDILPKFEILREDQIELKFGKADRITSEDYGTGTVFYREYTYIPRHMIVSWSVRHNKLDGILIEQSLDIFATGDQVSSSSGSSGLAKASERRRLPFDLNELRDEVYAATHQPYKEGKDFVEFDFSENSIYYDKRLFTASKTSNGIDFIFYLNGDAVAMGFAGTVIQCGLFTTSESEKLFELLDRVAVSPEATVGRFHVAASSSNYEHGTTILMSFTPASD